MKVYHTKMKRKRIAVPSSIKFKSAIASDTGQCVAHARKKTGRKNEKIGMIRRRQIPDEEEQG